MEVYLNDVADTDEKQICEVNGTACITSELDRVKFVNPAQGISGDLGMKLYKDYWDAPTYNSQGAGTLDNSKFYSIILKPVSTYISDPNSGEFMTGALGHYSDPYSPIGTDQSIIYDLPDLSDQKAVFFAGEMEGGDATTVADTDRDWGTDIWAGYQVLNTSTNLTANIISNTATELTVDADIDPKPEDKYHIVNPLVTGFVIYGIEMNAATDILVGVYTLQGYADADDGTFELADFVAGGATAVDSNYPPDPYYACVTADSKMIAGGGFIYDDGEAEVDTREFETAASVTYPIGISTRFKYATVAGTSGDLDNIMRYTFSDSSQYQTYMRRGSIVSINGAEDLDNDLDEAVVTQVADDGSWFEVINEGTDNSEDETLSLLFSRNVLVGNTSGENKTEFGEGLVGGKFKFANDVDPYTIAWVNRAEQECGLFEKYVGRNTGDGAYEIRPTTWISTTASSTYSYNIGATVDSPVPDMRNDWTMCFWYKLGSSIQNQVFFQLGDNYSSRFYVYYDINDAPDDYIRIETGHGSSTAWAYYEKPDESLIFESDTWAHVAVTYSLSTAEAQIYINGTLLSPYAEVGSLKPVILDPATAKMSLGSPYSLCSYDDMRIFDVVLTESEVQAVRDRLPTNNMIEHFKFDDGSGDVFASALGNSPMRTATFSSVATNHPTISDTGMVWTVDHVWPDTPVIVNDESYSVYTDFGLGWSDVNYPHIFRTENITPVSDSIVALAAYNQTLILFCRNSVQAVPLAGLGQTPYLISDDVQCTAPHSIVTTTNGVFFYDGSGFSLTDGQQIIPVTAYRAADYLGYINNSRAVNIRGVYDPKNRRIEYYFPYGDDYNNNYGLTISTDSMNCYPSQRLDVNAAWLDRNDEGDATIHHGTTDDITDGTIWQHDPDLGTDGGYEQELAGNITSISGQTITVDFGEEFDEASVVSSGSPCMYMPDGAGNYFQFRAVSVTQSSGSVYTIVAEESLDTDELATGGYIIIGGIPFDYGIKWTDFSSPQYKHNIKQVHLDVTNFSGILFVEHYKDMKEKVAWSTSHYVSPDDTKVVSEYKAGDCYTYGFRIYGVSMSKFEFHSFEILFDTEQ